MLRISNPGDSVGLETEKAQSTMNALGRLDGPSIRWYCTRYFCTTVLTVLYAVRRLSCPCRVPSLALRIVPSFVVVAISLHTWDHVPSHVIPRYVYGPLRIREKHYKNYLVCTVLLTMMLRSRVTSIATQMANNNRLQRRGFVNYLINYPDKVSSLAVTNESQMKGQRTSRKIPPSAVLVPGDRRLLRYVQNNVV